MIDLKQIRELSVEERILMVESIWDSIAEDTTSQELKIPEAEQAEILRQFDEFMIGNKKTYSWEEVKMYARRTK